MELRLVVLALHHVACLLDDRGVAGEAPQLLPEDRVEVVAVALRPREDPQVGREVLAVGVLSGCALQRGELRHAVGRGNVDTPRGSFWVAPGLDSLVLVGSHVAHVHARLAAEVLRQVGEGAAPDVGDHPAEERDEAEEPGGRAGDLVAVGRLVAVAVGLGALPRLALAPAHEAGEDQHGEDLQCLADLAEELLGRIEVEEHDSRGGADSLVLGGCHHGNTSLLGKTVSGFRFRSQQESCPVPR